MKEYKQVWRIKERRTRKTGDGKSVLNKKPIGRKEALPKFRGFSLAEP